MYLLYTAYQTLLVLMALITSRRNNALFSAWPAQKLNLRSFSYLILLGSIAAISFTISLIGSIFLIFGVYNNCLCLTALSHWVHPKNERWVELLSDSHFNPDIDSKNISFSVAITWATAGLTGAICYLGFWYQKVLKRAMAVELDRL